MAVCDFAAYLVGNAICYWILEARLELDIRA